METTTEAATKKVRISLSALTRVEYSEILEVPAGMTDGQLDDLVRQRYEEVDGGEFDPDNEFWERGECHFDAEDDDAQAEGTVALVDGRLVVTKNAPEED